LIASEDNDLDSELKMMSLGMVKLKSEISALLIPPMNCKTFSRLQMALLTFSSFISLKNFKAIIAPMERSC